MKVRTSENSHEFQTKLFNRLKAYSLQGLLMDDKHDFTAALEAIEYEDGDDTTKLPFTANEIHARYTLASEAGIPLYILCYIEGIYRLYKVKENMGDVSLSPDQRLDENGFIQWWGDHKKTVQTKLLNNGGEKRLGETIFDSVLRKHGYEWGGNIDGFVLTDDDKQVKYIIDNISVSKSNLNDEPSHYFNSPDPRHGPRYEGWYGAVKLAHQIHVPHVLFTIDKHEVSREHIGFTVIDKLTPEGIFFVESLKPNDNILNRMENIVRIVNETVEKSVPPELIEKEKTNE